tara:strand:+ start:84 stop:692 length:609 start_codon:yes stop_codon:yes gene_type:complete
MGLYDDKKTAPAEGPEVQVQESKTFDEISYALSIKDSLVYLAGEIDEYTVTELMARMRIVIDNRDPKMAKDPMNLIIDSHGGCAYSMFGIIDFIESLEIKVNTICRGRAFSAGALILASGTGTRYASKRSTIMLHEGSSAQVGKYSDLKVASKQADKMEAMVRTLLAEKTKKDEAWWEDNLRTDLWLDSSEALDLGIIDEIG